MNSGLGVEVQGQDIVVRVLGLRFMAWNSGFMDSGSGVEVQGVG